MVIVVPQNVILTTLLHSQNPVGLDECLGQGIGPRRSTWNWRVGRARSGQRAVVHRAVVARRSRCCRRCVLLLLLLEDLGRREVQLVLDPPLQLLYLHWDPGLGLGLHFEIVFQTGFFVGKLPGTNSRMIRKKEDPLSRNFSLIFLSSYPHLSMALFCSSWACRSSTLACILASMVLVVSSSSSCCKCLDRSSRSRWISWVRISTTSCN